MIVIAGEKPRWAFCEGRTPLTPPCPECGGQLFEHPTSQCEDEECPENGRPNVVCEFLECNFAYMCRSVLTPAPEHRQCRAAETGHEATFVEEHQECSCHHPRMRRRCRRCQERWVADGPAKGCLRCHPELLQLLTHQGGCLWLRRHNRPLLPGEKHWHAGAEYVIPAGRGARHRARRMAKKTPGVYVVVRSRSHWAQYQVVWHAGLGFMTHVFDRSAGADDPRRCRMTSDQFDYRQQPVRLTPWRCR